MGQQSRTEVTADSLSMGSLPAQGQLARWAVAIASILTGFALLLRHLHQNGFWIDEMYSMHAINLPVREMIVERVRRGHLPLYFLLAKGVLAISGAAATETSLRAFSITFWVGAVASFIPLAQRFLDRRIAPIAVTAFALNQMVMHQALQARMYEMMIFEAVWIARAYLEIAAGSRWTGWKVVFAVASLCAFWTSASVSLVFVPIIYDSWSRRSNRPDMLRLVLLTVAMAAVSMAPAVLFHFATRQRNQIADTIPINLLLHFVTLAGIMPDEIYYDTTAALRAMQVLGLVFVAIILAAFWRVRRARGGGHGHGERRHNPIRCRRA